MMWDASVMEALPIDIDQLFIDVFYFFYHSSKRKQIFSYLWCSLFTTEPDVILKHCPTRWLSLLRCVGRYLAQLEGLKSFFLSTDEQTDKVEGVTSRLQNPLLKPILLFLSHILPAMDRFNRMFQKSNENTTCQLYTEMSRLTRSYAANLLKRSVISALGTDLSRLGESLGSDKQVSNEHLGIGDSTWAAVAELEQEHDTKPFFSAVRNFYIASLKKMLKKFPFDDTLLKDLGILQPNKTATYEVSTVVKLAKRFPQLGLASSDAIDALSDEFRDLKLSKIELPTPKEYKAADGIWKPRAGSFWWEFSKMKTLDGRTRFPRLFKLMAGNSSFKR